MDFAFSEKSLRIQEALQAFIAEHVAPRDAVYARSMDVSYFPLLTHEVFNATSLTSLMSYHFPPCIMPYEPGTQMYILNHVTCAATMSRIDWASEVFNSSAPGTGNMELLHLA